MVCVLQQPSFMQEFLGMVNNEAENKRRLILSKNNIYKKDSKYLQLNMMLKGLLGGNWKGYFLFNGEPPLLQFVQLSKPASFIFMWLHIMRQPHTSPITHLQITFMGVLLPHTLWLGWYSRITTSRWVWSWFAEARAVKLISLFSLTNPLRSHIHHNPCRKQFLFILVS